MSAKRNSTNIDRVPGNWERVFSRREQAVVYLFARYWQRMDEFRDADMAQIGTRFPDCLLDNGGKKEAVEFEYALGSFRSHFRERGKSLRTLQRLTDAEKLWVVYWEDNDDRGELEKEILRYSKESVVPRFICLRDHFKARVARFPNEPLQPFWEFSSTTSPAAYRRAALEKALKRHEGSVRRLKVQRGLYRTMGFNTNQSDFVECEHWAKIHMYTSGTKMNESFIPEKLFMKPTGCRYYAGYFCIHDAVVIESQSPEIDQLFRDFYFYEYRSEWHKMAKLFVCDFVPFSREAGTELYESLQGLGYRLTTMTPPIIRPEHKSIVEAIVSL